METERRREMDFFVGFGSGLGWGLLLLVEDLGGRYSKGHLPGVFLLG